MCETQDMKFNNITMYGTRHKKTIFKCIMRTAYTKSINTIILNTEA